MSTARAVRVCEPTARPASEKDPAHGLNGPPSRLHSSSRTGSDAASVNDAALDTSEAVGADLILVFGGVPSTNTTTCS